MSKPSDLVQGALDLLILKILALEPLHGWAISQNNRRAKFYSLTRLGRKELEKEAANWNRLSAAISRVVKLKEA
jgi:PadR family transcriptional regulator PadR